MANLKTDLLTRVAMGKTEGRHGKETLFRKLQFDGRSCISISNLQTSYEGYRLQPRGWKCVRSRS